MFKKLKKHLHACINLKYCCNVNTSACSHIQPNKVKCVNVTTLSTIPEFVIVACMIEAHAR